MLRRSIQMLIQAENAKGTWLLTFAINSRFLLISRQSFLSAAPAATSMTNCERKAMGGTQVRKSCNTHQHTHTYTA